jgi:hypothetical protein
MEISAKELNNETQIKKLIEEGLANETIVANFQKLGFDDNQLNELKILIQKIRNKKRTQTGSILVLIGVSYIGTWIYKLYCVALLGADINFSLYGLTGIGAIALIVGLDINF